MKFSEKWLREWANPSITTAQLATQLTMAGLEVEAIEEAAGDLQQVYVAQVLEVTRHPNADRLSVCKVTLGKGEPLTIVCGASNVQQNMKTALAIEGAVLPGNLQIKRSKIRDIESHGMLCSVSELGLAETSKGIIELPADAPVGSSFSDYMNLPDKCIEINLTPNRGDCLSIAGVARELAAINHSAINLPAFKSNTATLSDTFPIELLAPVDCPHYIGRIIRNINPKAVTPLWLQERLRRSNLRSINPVVDVTNYVMLELGQPLHAFNLNMLDTAIQIRRAHAEETITLLDGQALTLNEEMLVIADSQQILALAGIMGGANSGVNAETTDLFLESAFFDPITIATTARRLHLHTDAAYRFERGVDPQLQACALERATDLLLMIVGGQAGPLIEKTAIEYLPKLAVIKLRRDRIKRILGILIKDNEIENILKRLGMELKVQAEGWEVTAPSYRFDIRLEIDLIEELARVYGYENIPANTPVMPLNMQAPSEQKLNLSRLRMSIIDQGFRETISYSFISPKLAELINPEQAIITLSNPISADMAVMRSSLWPGLINALAYNANRQQTRVRLFETGLCFNEQDQIINQQPRFAGIIAGSAYPEQWGMVNRKADFFDLKNNVENLLALTGENTFHFVAESHPALHPGQSASILRANKKIGWIGALHPHIQQQLDLPPIYLFELVLADLEQAVLPSYQVPSKFPAVRRDLAIVIEQAVPLQQIYDKITGNAGNLLQQLQLFDIYQGDGIDTGKKSLALSLTFQLHSRTLVDSEVNHTIEQVVNMLKHEFNATLRT